MFNLARGVSAFAWIITVGIASDLALDWVRLGYGLNPVAALAVMVVSTFCFGAILSVSRNVD